MVLQKQRMHVPKSKTRIVFVCMFFFWACVPAQACTWKITFACWGDMQTSVKSRRYREIHA